ncbi:MAG TPA: ATP-binding protein [Candidatus Obscuribacterales bacterium]
MQPYKHKNTKTIDQLAAELEVANTEIKLLRSQLQKLGTDLADADVRSTEQTQLLHDMSVRSDEDAKKLRTNDAQIARQLIELDLAHKAVALQRDLEAANKELETFSYSVSHDLRSPLRSINGFAKALLEDYARELPEEARRYLEHIEKSAVKMGTLIDDLLSFSRLSRLDLSAVSLDLKAMALNVWAEITANIDDRKIELEVAELPRIRADRAMMRQVLINLFSNAVKFTAPREIAHVKLFEEERGDEFIFCVRDNGVGFDDRFMDKLFGPFQRLHKSKDFPGTGIGLALVQRIIHRHGGKVWAESQLGAGASFYFSIPKKSEEFIEA